jgi:hypothetical protein
MSQIITSLRTPEFFAQRIGNVKKDPKSFSNLMLLFSLQPAELAAAIGFRPAIAEELAHEAESCEAMALVWSRAQAGLDAQAASKAVEDVLSHHSRITLASHF